MIGEIGTLPIKDVSFGKLGAHLERHRQDGVKAGLSHQRRSLSRVVAQHPPGSQTTAKRSYKRTSATPNRGKQMNHPGIRKLLYNLFRKAGVNKKSKLHNFRHAGQPTWPRV
ncbi:MAG: hypothetical protein M5U25_11450 [Planctomycetota bacterium]|nr:hypothetical protein [Planctomycetota bacterium]